MIDPASQAFASFRGSAFQAGSLMVPQEGERIAGQAGPEGFVGNLRNLANTVLINDDGITVTGSAGTVIIDGTSNMFKIIASGTQSIGLPSSGASSIQSTTLTALGAQTATPGHITYLAWNNLNTGNRYLGALIATVNARFVANSSGGSPTEQVQIPDNLSVAFTNLSGGVPPDSDLVVHSIRGWNDDGIAGQTLYAKYYILKETAI